MKDCKCIKCDCLCDICLSCNPVKKKSKSMVSSTVAINGQAKSNEALKISKYIIENVVLPKMLGKPAAKKKKIVSKLQVIPEPEPPQVKRSPSELKKSQVVKSPSVVSKPKRLLKKKVAGKVKEPTHKEQCTSTDDLTAAEEKAKKAAATKRKVKPKPKIVEKPIEPIVEPNPNESSESTAYNIHDSFGGGGGGGGDGDLIISEITVKFCRRNQV